MKTITKDGVTVTYPDYGYAFNPVNVHVKATEQESIVYGNGGIPIVGQTGIVSTVDGSVKSDPDNNFGWYLITLPFAGQTGRTLNMQMYINTADQGSAFYSGNSLLEFVSGVKGSDYVSNDGDRATINIPDNATTFRFGYYSTRYAESRGIPIFDNFTVTNSNSETLLDGDIYIEAGNDVSGFISYTRHAINGETDFDLSAITKTLFNRKEFYSTPEEDDTLLKNMTVRVGRIIDGARSEVLSFELPVIWGALQIGEDVPHFRDKYTYFKGYPFTLPVIVQNPTLFRKRVDSNEYTFEKWLNVGEIEIDWTLNTYINSVTGLAQATTIGFNSSDFIEVSEGDVIDVYYGAVKEHNNRAVAVIAPYDENQNYVSPSVTENGSNEYSYTVPAGIKYVRFSQHNNAVDYQAISDASSQILAKYNMPIDEPEATERIVIRLEPSQPQGGIYDQSFDTTFKGVADDAKIIEIKVNSCDAANTHYLRWINKEGEFNYWLFRDITSQAALQASSVSFNELYTKTGLSDPLNTGRIATHCGTGQYIGKIGQNSIQVGAAIVTSEEFDFVLGITESPYVELFLGYSDTGMQLWERVTIASGTYQKNLKTLQDLVITVNLPLTQIQIL